MSAVCLWRQLLPDDLTALEKQLVQHFARASVNASPKVLRSTFASVAADLGYSGGTIAEMLGHARQGVTERLYIRRIDAVVIAAADAVSETIETILAGVSSTEI